jgi:flagellar basal-body rod protein FlgG
MNRALYTAATGMIAQQMNVDNIANNLANVNTTGYKKSKLEFQDLLYQQLRPAGVSQAEGAQVPVELQVGYGTRPVATQRLFSQGTIVQTDNPLDVSIDGDGFLQVTLPDGSTAYTRDGALKLSADGDLVTSDGYAIQPQIAIPPDAADITIATTGEVSVKLPGDSTFQEVGRLELARFSNPAGLKSIGRNLLLQTQASGAAVVGSPGQDGLGKVTQRYLEMSNVEVVDEMVNMIVAQRAYEINAKAIQTAEEMLANANNLKR